MRVVNDLMPHEYRRAKPSQSIANRSDRPIDPRAKPARACQQNRQVSHANVRISADRRLIAE
jgi:hypothetical protein